MPGDAWVLVDLEIDRVGPVLVEVTQRLFQFFGVGDHGAEFVHAEFAAAIAGAFLHEHHRPRAGELDDQRQAEQQRRNQQQNRQRAEAGHHPIGARQLPWTTAVAAREPAATLAMNRRIEAHSVLGVDALVAAHFLDRYTFLMSSHGVLR